MDPLIREELEKEDISPFHEELLKHCKGLVAMSRDKMSEYHSRWEMYDEVYQGRRVGDKQDQQATARGEPGKIVVPLSYAQIQTFIAFCFAMYYQREHLFELMGMSVEDHEPAKVGEALLDRDLTYNVFDARLYQFLLDVSRFGVGVLKHGWVEKLQKVKSMKPVEPTEVGGELVGEGRMQEVEEEIVKYQGNKIVNVSPFRFYPDVRLPLSRFQEGEFVGSEDEVTMVSLKQREKEGEVAGLQHVKPLTTKDMEHRRGSKLVHTKVVDDVHAKAARSTGVVVLTEVQVTLIPSEFKISEDKPMGDSPYPEKWNVWYVNDSRIVKAEPMNYIHGEYTYDLAEFSPDMHQLLSDGLSGTVAQLQNVVDWFINSHITSVRKTIQNWLVIDPEAFEVEDLKNRGPVLRLKPGMARAGIDRYVKQLAVQDVTQNHVQDAKFLHEVMQIVTGINENALGQFHKGRRSATEARNVNSATAARLQVTSRLIWNTALAPLARKMLSNLRDGLSADTYVRVIGETADPMRLMAFKKVTRTDLVGDYDIKIYDGTLPSERMYQADVLKELVMALFSNPEAIALLGYDPRLLIREILELRGIKNPERFQLQPQGPDGHGIQANVGGGPAALGGGPQDTQGFPSLQGLV